MNEKNQPAQLTEYEKEILEKFRRLRIENQKKGMAEKAKKGNLVTRVPFGYQVVDGKLIPAQNYMEIQEIFEEFLKETISLRKLAAKHNLSVNGLKKILKNFTYIGKIKFDGEVHQGNHQPIISTTLFNHVQNKLKILEEKKEFD